MGFEFSDAQLARYQQSVARDVTAAFWDVLIARESSASRRRRSISGSAISTKRRSARPPAR
jgi:hypothetical protein